MTAKRRVTDPGPTRITAVTLDNETIVRWSAEVEHERQVAMFDLLEANHFHLRAGPDGPYELHLGLEDATLLIDVRPEIGRAVELRLPVRPFRAVVKDYFFVCESYYNAIKTATPGRIESLDMARRGLHNEGSEQLKDALADRIEMDDNTARRLFTLVCVLHIRG